MIQCKSEVDQEACLYADEVRKLPQREYDNADLYSDADTAQAELKERLQQNFISYFREAMYKRHKIAPLLFFSIGRELWTFLKCMREKICRFSKSTMLLPKSTNVSF